MENFFDNDNKDDILSEIDINLLDDSKQENYFKDDDDIIFNEIPENLVSVKRKIRETFQQNHALTNTCC